MANKDDQRDDQAREDQQPSPVRRRVTRHLRNLLIPGVMGLGACKNADTPVVCDPMPPPADAGAAGPPSGADAEAATDAATEAAPTAAPSQPPPVVCDPMPAPIAPPPPPEKKK